MQAKTVKKGEIIKRKRGRPRLSNLPDKEQARLRMRRIRERRREEKLVPIEVWIPKSQREALLNMYPDDLSTAAIKAFTLLIIFEHKGLKIDLDNPVSDFDWSLWPIGIRNSPLSRYKAPGSVFFFKPSEDQPDLIY